MRESSKGRKKKTRAFNRRLAGAFIVLLEAGAFVSCGSSREISVAAPVDPGPAASRFERVLVTSFVARTDEELDLDLETVRILRNQLRARSAHVVSGKEEKLDHLEAKVSSAGPEISRQEWMDLDRDKHLNDDEYWRKLGATYHAPLIVSGKLHFAKVFHSGFMSRNRYVQDVAGGPRLVRDSAFEERVGYALSAEFYFIDGSTGKTIRRAGFTERVFYRPNERVPVLASYFELMGRMLPEFLTVLSRVVEEPRSL